MIAGSFIADVIVLGVVFVAVMLALLLIVVTVVDTFRGEDR